MCPVAIFKEFLCHSPLELGTTGPLYLSCVKDPTSQVWYKRQPMGVNKINQMMEPIIKDTSLEEHSARKTVVKKVEDCPCQAKFYCETNGPPKLAASR